MGLFDTVKKVVVGDVAHDAADGGNPLKIGGKAATSTPAAVSAGDRVNAYFDANGRQVVIPATGATDDAAAAGEIFPVAGLYQGLGAIDFVDVGDIGRARITARRALVTGIDTSMMAGADGVVSPTDAGYRDIQISRTSAHTGYGDVVGADFNHASITTDPFWIRVPMIGWGRGALVNVMNTLGVNVAFQLILDHNPVDGWSSRLITVIDQYTLPHASELAFSPHAIGASPGSTVWRAVPAMLTPTRYLVLRCEAASDPTSGYLLLSIVR